MPEHTTRILGLSGRRLPDQVVPPMFPSPPRPIENDVWVGGTLPRIGDTPVPNPPGVTAVGIS